MSGDTITHDAPAAEASGTRDGGTSFAPGRAARELGLRRSEYDLAVHLGLLRTLPDEGGGGRRVARAEIDRLRAQDGFPGGLRQRVATAGTRAGAARLGITGARFTRLARLGLLVPVSFYLNRYRAVVWLYLTDDLERFAADERNAPLLNRALPEGLRDQLAGGLDLRPRNWRGRHLGFLLRVTDDPWARAAAIASLLTPDQVAHAVTDPRERAVLDRLRSRHSPLGTSGSPAARLVERLMTADEPDEVAWLRADLTNAVDEARAHDRGPDPAVGHSSGGRRAGHDHRGVPDGPRRACGLMRRIFHRSA
ncbi:DUF6397 family protein [Streptomyces tropicalis]|uniref:DUF6397 family protein n=1 Tax=Streptomyces tropicalis TaxID=3034234 RepID=A0ABT6A418_9ACTN|nr:DUF6397 family protein [Streptomyces tropicalis]MDF3299398.1 DUF6397 family protein [Streptomyces tropicalis]